MRIDLRMVTGTVVAAALALTTAADMLKLTAATDRADALYRIGEEAVFTVTASNATGGKATAGRLAVTLDDWCRHTLVERTVDLAKENPFVVSGKLGEPGFVRLRVKGEGLEKPFLGGVAFEPERIVPGGTCPDDFDAFWREAQAKLEAEVPLDPRLEHRPERSTATYDFWRVSFATAGGRRVWGFMSVPKDKSKAPFPVSFEVASAGEGKWTMDMASGSPDRIRMYFTVHYFEPPATVPELLVIRKKLSEDLKAKYGVASYSAAGIAVSREDYYFYPSILGINRAVNWLWNRDDVDRTRFNYTGGSQGGGFGLYLCGLNPKFTSAVLNVPAICDTLGSLKGRICGFPYVLEMNRTKDRAAAALRNAPYFNGAFFASRIRCPIRFIIGFIDEICPPPGIYAAYNNLASKDKGIVHGLIRGHGGWPEGRPAHDWQESRFFKTK